MHHIERQGVDSAGPIQADNARMAIDVRQDVTRHMGCYAVSIIKSRPSYWRSRSRPMIIRIT
jgi:hypothetical protein